MLGSKNLRCTVDKVQKTKAQSCASAHESYNSCDSNGASWLITRKRSGEPSYFSLCIWAILFRFPVCFDSWFIPATGNTPTMTLLFFWIRWVESWEILEVMVLRNNFNFLESALSFSEWEKTCNFLLKAIISLEIKQT